MHCRDDSGFWFLFLSELISDLYPITTTSTTITTTTTTTTITTQTYRREISWATKSELFSRRITSAGVVQHMLLVTVIHTASCINNPIECPNYGGFTTLYPRDTPVQLRQNPSPSQGSNGFGDTRNHLWKRWDLVIATRIGGCAWLLPLLLPLRLLLNRRQFTAVKISHFHWRGGGRCDVHLPLWKDNSIAGQICHKTRRKVNKFTMKVKKKR